MIHLSDTCFVLIRVHRHVNTFRETQFAHILVSVPLRIKCDAKNVFYCFPLKAWVVSYAFGCLFPTKNTDSHCSTHSFNRDEEYRFTQISYCMNGCMQFVCFNTNQVLDCPSNCLFLKFNIDLIGLH